MTLTKQQINKKISNTENYFNKFNFQDRYLAEFKVPAWTDMYSKNKS